MVLAQAGFGLPGDVVAQHGVEGCDHLAHDGNDDDFELFVGGGEATVEDFGEQDCIGKRSKRPCRAHYGLATDNRRCSDVL